MPSAERARGRSVPAAARGWRSRPWLAPAALALLLLMGLALRLWWVQAFPGELSHDQTKYLAGAKKLAAGRGVDNTYWPVGYKLWLAGVLRAFGPSVQYARYVNIALSVGSMLCVYRLARVGTGSSGAALLALGLLALSPVDAGYCALLVTEPLYSFLSLLAACLALGPRAGRLSSLGAGAVAGLAALTRAHGVLLPALFASAGQPRPWTARKLAVAAALMYLGLCLSMGPWWVRNARELGAFVPTSSNGGMNLLIGNNPGATGGFKEDETVWRMLSERRAIDGRGRSEVAVNARARELALEYIAAHPREALSRVPDKLAALYAPDLTPLRWNKPKDPAQRKALRAFRPALERYQHALYAAALVGLLILSARAFSRREPPHPVMLTALAIILSTSLVHAVYFGGARFHFPLLPWMTLLAVAPFSARPAPAH